MAFFHAVNARPLSRRRGQAAQNASKSGGYAAGDFDECASSEAGAPFAEYVVFFLYSSLLW